MISSFFKNKIVIIILFGVVVIFASYIINKSSKNIVYQNNSQNLEVVTLGDLVSKDTDGDGVKDWEETLWGTDPQKTDTFGVPDKEYIDKKRKENPIVSANTKTESKKINETDDFARELFSATLSLKQSGNLNEDTIKTLTDGLESKLGPKSAPIYSINDISTVKKTPESISLYKIDLGRTVSIYKKYNLGFELSVLSKALSMNDKYILSGFSNYGKHYEEMAKVMLGAKVPEEIANSHLEVINGYSGVAKSIEKMAVVFDNPVVGMNGLAEYALYDQKTTTALNKIRDFFEENTSKIN